jgi:alpha-L-rhamnosidase
MPWEFYLQYADTSMLKNNYEGMKGYIKYMLTWTDENGIMFSKVPGPDGKPNRWMNLGDWSQPDKLPPDEMVHTFYLWRCTDLTAKSAKVLGKKAEYEEYTKLTEKTRQAFQTKFYNIEKGTYGAWGGNIFALKMGVPDDQKERVVAALKADLIANGGHLDTGIFGTQFFFEVLSENGLHDMAYDAMNKRTAPAYGWWIEKGATTSWEGWEDPGSGNHPMFGGGIVWFYRKLAGMNADPEQPGYRHIIFRPQPVNEISYVSYSNLTPYGTCAINWKKENGKFLMEIFVPVGSTATAFVPVTGSNPVMEGGEKIESNAGITYNRAENGYAVFTVGSGRYRFESKL